MTKTTKTLILASSLAFLSACGGNAPSPRTVRDVACAGARTVCRVVDRVCDATGAPVSGGEFPAE